MNGWVGSVVYWMRILSSLMLLAFVAALVTPSMAEPELTMKVIDPTADAFSEQGNTCQENSNFQCCGDIQLIFRNPDLNPSAGAPIKAHGSLFAQFQAIGENADKIAFFGFSFSAVAQQASEEQICGQQPWAPSGAYVLNYRADTNAEDGFFINLQTDLVPDGEYMAAVHGFDANDNEIARAWTLAAVDNCDPGAMPPRCEGDTAQHIRQDQTQPWMIMLPGDGNLDPANIDAPSEATLTLEFAEELSELRVYVNGVLVHDKTGTVQGLQSYPGRQWDDDLLPGYGPNGLGGEVVPECTYQPPQTCGTLGEAWYYDQPITDDDIVRVEAYDMAGNLAKKELHIGSGVGGAQTNTAPSLTFTAEVLERQVPAGSTAIFPVSFQNTGGTTAHPIASATGPDGWELEWFPAHTPTGPGQTSKQELNARVPPAEKPGIYKVNATIEYDAGGGQTKAQKWSFTVLVGDGVSVDETGNETKSDGKGKDSPGPGALVPVGIAIAAMRRRRH